MAGNPDEGALEALRRHQEVMGMTFENPDAPVEAPDAGMGTPAWMLRDEEIR